MDVIVIQHVSSEGSGAIGAALRARDIDERVVRTDRGDEVPRGLDGAAGLLVMGGPMGVYEADRFPHLRDEIRLIERAVAQGLPVLGVCLGSQLVAAALGARVERARGLEIGWRAVRLEDAARTDALLAQCPPSLVPLSWHGDVFELPKGAVSLASSDMTEHQAFRFGGSTWGLLFHMEMDATQIEAMATGFAGDLDAAGLSRSDLLGGVAARLSTLGPVAARAFGAWADRVKAANAHARNVFPSGPRAPK
jgi:GMP synthase (glutamine-hydrolysing)